MRPTLQMPQLRPYVGHLIVGLATSWTGLAHATDSSAAAAAVAKLLALPVQSGETATAATDAAQRPVVTVLRGENLDRVVRRTLPGLPLKDEFLRKAFVLLNPGTLDNRSTRILPAGTRLYAPTAQDLLALLGQQYPALFNARMGETRDEAAAATQSAKRRWVQFP